MKSAIFKLLLLVLCIPMGLFARYNKTFLHVNGNNNPIGMFANFNYVVSLLYEYESHPYAGLEVDFGETGLYYDPQKGPNWWEYYCEPIRLGSKRRSSIKKFTPKEFSHYASRVEKSFNRNLVNGLINKYIKLKPHIQNKIEQFYNDHFKGQYVICVHYRGTDKIHEAPFVPYEIVIDSLNEHIAKNQLENYKIFVATDEERFLQMMNERYPGSIIAYSTLRSNDNHAVHVFAKENYLKGEEAIIDCLLLSKGDFLIRTSSNLSIWSTYFNPSIPVNLLIQRYRS